MILVTDVLVKPRDSWWLATTGEGQSTLCWFFHRGLHRGLWQPWGLLWGGVPLRGGLDGDCVWPEGVSSSVHQKRHLQGWQVWVRPGMDRGTLQYWWGSTHTHTHTTSTRYYSSIVTPEEPRFAKQLSFLMTTCHKKRDYYIANSEFVSNLTASLATFTCLLKAYAALSRPSCFYFLASRHTKM